MKSNESVEKNTSNAHARESAAEWVDINSLSPWDKNPRRNDENVKRVADSIRRFGFASPIVARTADKTIIAGHTRWKAACLLGLDKVPVRFMDLDPAEAKLLTLADNRLNELSEWDINGLQEILSEYGLKDAELAGWSSNDLEEMASELIGKDVEEAVDDSHKVEQDFCVLIECKDEQEQIEILTEAEQKGWKCRALI